jgi:hypothetical protein
MAANGDILPGKFISYIKGAKSTNTLTLIYVDGHPVNSKMYNNLINLKNAALEAGITLLVSSGYRDAFDDVIYEGEQIAESQLTLREQNLKPEYIGVKNPADASLKQEIYFKKPVAPPGYSKHNNGTAVDFNTGSRTGTLNKQLDGFLYQWLVRNSWKYGFVRTVSKEEWHFNYLGINKTKLGPYSIISPSPDITGNPTKYPYNLYYDDLGLNNLRLIDSEYISVIPDQPIPLSNI